MLPNRLWLYETHRVEIVLHQLREKNTGVNMWGSVIKTQTDRSLILISHSMMSFTCGGPPEPHSFRALKHMKGQKSSRVEEGASVLILLTDFTSLTHL